MFELLAKVPGDFGGGMKCNATSELASAKAHASVSADAGDAAIEAWPPEELFEFGLFGEAGDRAAFGFNAEEADIEGFEFGE